MRSHYLDTNGISYVETCYIHALITIWNMATPDDRIIYAKDESDYQLINQYKKSENFNIDDKFFHLSGIYMESFTETELREFILACYSDEFAKKICPPKFKKKSRSTEQYTLNF